MRICMLTTSYPLRSGDYAGQFVHALAQGLQQFGHSVRVVAPHAPGSPKSEELGGVPVQRFQYAVPARLQKLAYGGGIPFNLAHDPIAKLNLPGFFAAFALAALRWSRDCDLVHAHWSASGLVGLWAAGRRGVPLVVACRGSDLNRIPSRGPIARATRYVLSKADAVMTVSEALAERAQQLGSDPVSTHVIWNAVDTDTFSPGGHAPVNGTVLWVGRMTDEKGLDCLIDAMGQVAQACRGARLVMVGDGPLRSELEAMVANRGIEGSIEFRGVLPHTMIPEVMREAAVLALPSLSEGMPNVAIEAMSCGVPVVASNVGGVPEVVVDGETGSLIQPGDSPALARELTSLLQDETKRADWGRNARLRVERHFSREAQVRAVLDVYRDVGAL